MAESRLDPRSLAERLDAVLPPGQFDTPATGEGDPLVNLAIWLSISSQPETLAPAAKTRIRLEVLNAYQMQTPASAPAAPRAMARMRWIGVGVTLVVVFIGLIVVGVLPDDSATPSAGLTEEPALIGTTAPTLVETTLPGFVTSVPSTSTATTESPQMPVPPTDSSLPTTIVVEGPVEVIDANILTVFDMNIEIEPGDPILAEIQVGDHIRVEGEITNTEETIVIVAVSITIIEVEAPTAVEQPGVPQPAPPIIIPEGCKITGIGNNNPHLKCSDKGSKKSSK